MELFISLTVNGIATGAIYAMVAMGLILLIKAVGVLNFAQGDLLVFGAFAALFFIMDINLPVWAAILASGIIFAVLAIVFMFAIYWPLRKTKNPITIIISTIGASIMIKEGLMMLFGAEPRPVNYFMVDSAGKSLKIQIFGVNIQVQYLLAILVGAILIIGIFLLFEKFYAGRMMQAASQDKYTAELMGIPTIITIGATYILSFAIASIGGFMIAPIYSASTNLAALQFGAFAGVVIGGWGDIKGSVIGAMIVGFLQSYAYVFFDVYKDAAVFIVMILFLLFRPQGIFRSKISDKA